MKWGDWCSHCDVALDYYWPDSKMTTYVMLILKVILSAKMGLFGTAKNCSLWQTIAKAIGKPNKQRRGPLFYREKGGNWEGLFWMKLHWSKTGIQGGDCFSLVELLEQSISCRKCSLHLSYWGLYLMILSCWSLIDSSTVMDLQGYCLRATLTPESRGFSLVDFC